jgi:hypothetical protein
VLAEGDVSSPLIIRHPAKLPSAANLREHWRVRAKRIKSQRETAAALVRQHVNHDIWGEPGGIVVTMVRVAPRELDMDNLAHAFKGWVDGVADGLGLKSDRDPRVTWRWEQRKGKPRHRVGAVTVAAEHAVEIRIERREQVAA